MKCVGKWHSVCYRRAVYGQYFILLVILAVAKCIWLLPFHRWEMEGNKANYPCRITGHVPGLTHKSIWLQSCNIPQLPSVDLGKVAKSAQFHFAHLPKKSPCLCENDRNWKTETFRETDFQKARDSRSSGVCLTQQLLQSRCQNATRVAGPSPLVPVASQHLWRAHSLF